MRELAPETFFDSRNWAYALHQAARGAFGVDPTLPTELRIAEIVASNVSDSPGIGSVEFIAILRLANEHSFLRAQCRSVERSGTRMTVWDDEHARGRLERAPTLSALCRWVLTERDRERLGVDIYGGPRAGWP